MNLNPSAVRIIDYLYGKIQRHEIAEKSCRAENFARCVRKRLTLFLRQQLRQFGCVGFDNISNGTDDFLTRLNTGCTPSRKCFFSRGYGDVELRFRGFWTFDDGCFCGRIYNGHGLIA